MSDRVFPIRGAVRMSQKCIQNRDASEMRTHSSDNCGHEETTRSSEPQHSSDMVERVADWLNAFKADPFSTGVDKAERLLEFVTPDRPSNIGSGVAELVGMAIVFTARSGSTGVAIDNPDDCAKAALEASHHAELVEYVKGSADGGCFTAQALLAKIGGAEGICPNTSSQESR